MTPRKQSLSLLLTRHVGVRRAAQRALRRLSAEPLEARTLLASDFAAVATSLDFHANATVEHDDLSDAAELVVQLDTDRALYRDRAGRLLEMIWESPLADHGDGDGDEGQGADEASTLALATATEFTPSGIPLLNSLPTAPAAVYLDFDGNFEPQWGGSRNVITPPYDLDGDPTSFSAEEQVRIEEIWNRVREDFAPFNVNVTTEDPSDAVTTLSQVNTAVNRIRTFYFRTEFNVSNAAAVSNLLFNVQRDDGVAIYLNGVEVVRDNLPIDADYRTFAESSIGGDDETVFTSFPIEPALLVNGSNVIAVEVHQVSDTSSDVAFDMSVIATVGGVTGQFLLSPASDWSYLDDGSDQGTAWRDPGFNDSSWPVGAAKLGYGDSDITTNLAVYEQGAPRVRTYYFRRDFNLANPTAVTNLTLGLLRDDGAAVYLNGVEIARDNLAVNAAYDDFALSAVGGADESRFFPFSVSPSNLVTGRNVLAVEVHQQSDTSSDVSFDLRLHGTVSGTPNVAIVEAGSDWLYLDDGSNQGTAWRAPNFDDATWRTGTAQFGYGDTEVGTVRVAIGREDWYDGGAGGVAFVNSFDINGSTTVFAFTNGAGNGAKNLAEVSSHEAGHAFGLGHQSTFDPITGAKIEEYNPGGNGWAPIMGVSYGPALSTWHDGPTGSANNFQDDMARISRTSNGFGYRTDDHGDSRFNATPLVSEGGSFSIEGIIAQNTDLDTFSFTIPGPMAGGIRANLDVFPVGPNLDAVLEIRDASNAVIASDSPANSLNASLDVRLPAGDYTLVVRSNGDYGRVGQYTVTGDLDESLIHITDFQRTGPLGSRAAVSNPVNARIHFPDDSDEFAFFGQADQLVTVVVTPAPSTRITASIPGLIAPVTSASAGAPVILPLTALGASAEYHVLVSGDRPGNFTVQVGVNTALEAPGSNDATPVSLTGSDRGELAGRLAISGSAGDGSDVQQTLVPRGSQWHYLDDGSNQGTAWIERSFNDSAWPIGTAEFGYGDGDEVTELRESGTTGNRIRTFYFRHAFQVADASSIENLQVLLNSDDGAAVYLNGVEIQRENLPIGATFDTLASSTVNEEGVFVPAAALAGLLRDGNNTLAVEVHQASDSSSDVSFDLELLANVASDDIVRVSAIPAGSDWRYLDDGSNQRTAWREIGFNDSGWSVGAAELGYGESETTTLDETSSTGNRIRTFYFRHEFDLGSVASIDQGILRLLRDDSAAVYLNGVEIRRDNLAANAAYDDHATGTVSGGDEDVYFESTFDPALLIVGRNVVAVEVHQVNDSSSDVSFDLELVLEAIPGSIETVFEAGSDWKYLDDGSDQGTAWRDRNYNDSAWSTGSAELGYGDGDETTQIDEDDASGNRIRTFYFRKEFTLNDPASIGELSASLKFDDGVAVYLNGTEAVRVNLAPNAQYDDFATAGALDENLFFDYTIDPALLVTGRNVLAVEVHQDSDSSSDVSFDMLLRSKQASPEIDAYTFEVTAEQLGKSWDILLAGTDADFSGATLELFGPAGSAAIATAVAGTVGSNYDLGMLGIVLATPGTYTLRLESLTRGNYGIFAGSDVRLEVEANDTLEAANNPLAVGETVWGYASEQDRDHYRLSLWAGIPIAIQTLTPFGAAGGNPLNSLDPTLALRQLDGTLLVTGTIASDGRNAFLTYTPDRTGEYALEISSESGQGEYTLTIGLPGDANLDGTVDADDFAIWSSHRFSSNGVTWRDGDFNGDGFVDVRDFQIWNRLKFSSYPTAASRSTRTPLAAAAAGAESTIDRLALIDEFFRDH